MILQQDYPSTNSAATEQETQSFTVFFLPETVLLAFLKASILVMNVKCMFERLLTTSAIKKVLKCKGMTWHNGTNHVLPKNPLKIRNSNTIISLFWWKTLMSQTRISNYNNKLSKSKNMNSYWYHRCRNVVL